MTLTDYLRLNLEAFWISWYLVTRATDDGGEDGSGRIISGKASLHQTGTVVAYQSGGLFVVTHVEGVPEIDTHTCESTT